MVIEIKNQYLTVQFNELGGALTSIKDEDGLEYLWQGDSTYWSGQAPVLFPICGSLVNNWAIYRPSARPFFTGVIPRHGLVRKKTFDLIEQTDDTVVFSIQPDKEIYNCFPYQFELQIRYRLINRTIHTEYLVMNHEPEKRMPYFIGAHPGFNCPLMADESYEDYYIEFEKEETCSIPQSFPDTGLLDTHNRLPFLNKQTRLDLNYNLFSHDAITFDRLQSRVVTLRSRKHCKGVSVSFKDFPNLVLWSTTNKSPFIAIEPWSGLSSSPEDGFILEDKPQVTFVYPGEISTKSFDITIL